MKVAEFFYEYRAGVESDVLPERVSNIFGYASVAEVAYVMELIRLREKGFDDSSDERSEKEVRAVVRKYEAQYSSIKRMLGDLAASLAGKPEDYVLTESELAAAQTVVAALKEFDDVYAYLDVKKARGLVSQQLNIFHLDSKDSVLRVESNLTPKLLSVLGCEDVYGFTKAFIAMNTIGENDAMYKILYKNFVKKHPDLSGLEFDEFKASLKEITKDLHSDRDTKLLYYNVSNGKVIVTKEVFEKRLHDKCKLRKNKDAKDLYAFFENYIGGEPEDHRLPVHRNEKIGRIEKSYAIYIFEIIRVNGLKDLNFFDFHKVYRNALNKLDDLEKEFKEITSLKKGDGYKEAVKDFLYRYTDLHLFYKNMTLERLEAFLEKARAEGNIDKLTLIDLNNEASKYTLYGAILAKKLNPMMKFDYGYFCSHIQGRFKRDFDEELFNKAVDSLIGKIILDKISGGTMSIDGRAIYTDTIVQELLGEYGKVKEARDRSASSTSSSRPQEQEVKVLADSLPGYESSTSSTSSSQDHEHKKHKHKHKESSSHSEKVKEEKKKSKHHSK